MSDDEKRLLLQDLCARLPHGVILIDNNGDEMPLDYKGTTHNQSFTEIL